jgi:hypothetical protein
MGVACPWARTPRFARRPSICPETLAPPYKLNTHPHLPVRHRLGAPHRRPGATVGRHVCIAEPEAPLPLHPLLKTPTLCRAAPRWSSLPWSRRTAPHQWGEHCRVLSPTLCAGRHAVEGKRAKPDRPVEHVAACFAPPRRRRRLCANHRVEPYTCKCRCHRPRAHPA